MEKKNYALFAVLSIMIVIAVVFMVQVREQAAAEKVLRKASIILLPFDKEDLLAGNEIERATFRVKAPFGEFPNGRYQGITAVEVCDREFERRDYPVKSGTYYGYGKLQDSGPQFECYIREVLVGDIKCNVDGYDCHTDAPVGCTCFYMKSSK